MYRRSRRVAPHQSARPAGTPASRASRARSNSCHAPPSGSAQRWPYQAGASGDAPRRREIGNVAQAEHALHDDADVHVARPRPEQDQARLLCPCGPCARARGIRRGRRRCRDCRECWRGRGTRAASAAPAASGGTATTSAASASRIEPPLAAAQAQPRRFHLRGRLAREAGRELLLEQSKVDTGGAGHRSGRVELAISPGR